MSNIDAPADGWELDLAGRIGHAVTRRRKQLLLTAVGLSERTEKLGYPITRVTISKIENNARAGKVDVAELLVLAAALEIPPVLLIFPGFPDAREQVLPGLMCASDAGARWASGTDGLPGAIDNEGDRGLYATSNLNAGIGLVEAANEARELRLSEFRLQIELDTELEPERVDHARRLVAQGQDRLAKVLAGIQTDLTELWGESSGQTSG